jgi:glycosyltransferase involved in cell wall biosynthesis
MRPAVSVIIPAYNQGHYLGSAIQSVLDQSFENFELLVVDDGSTDDTHAVVTAFHDPRLHYFYQANRGLPAARNQGILHAKGAYLSFLDSDDLFLPDKLHLLVAYLEARPEMGLVAGQSIPFDEKRRRPEKTYATPLPENGAALLLGNPLHVGSVLLRKVWQEEVGLFDERLRSYEDWDLWLRLARAGCPMGWVAQPVSLYRFHENQMTSNGSQMTQATFAVLDKVFADPELSGSWRSLRHQAYANAHLRAAAQAYLSRDYTVGKAAISRAAGLNPALTYDDAALLVKRINGWASSPKIAHRLRFLENIYNNLPDDLAKLRTRRRHELAQAAMHQAFESYHCGDFSTTRSVILKAFLYQADWLRNRGALAICLRVWLHPLLTRWT